MSKKTIVDVFEHSVKAYANNTFLMEKVGKTWVNTEASLLGKVSLDTCPFILGYIAKYPRILFRGSFLVSLGVAGILPMPLRREERLDETRPTGNKNALMPPAKSTQGGIRASVDIRSTSGADV